MDRALMYDLVRIDPKYLENVRQFVKEEKRHANKQNKNDIFCPYVDCENKIAWPDSKVVQSHLIKRGFKRNYIVWIKHGEIDDTQHEVDTGVGDNNSDSVFDGDDHDAAAADDFNYQELLRLVEPQVLSSMGTQGGLSSMAILEKSSKDIFYDDSNGCGKEFTQLRVMLELLKLKASHGWFENSFLELLSLLAKLLPKPNTLPTSTYKAKKLICPLSLGVEKIHACSSHCILYRKEYEFNTKCLICGVSRYKRSYNHVYANTMKKKIKNKNKAAIVLESVDDEANPNKEDMTKRKIPVLVM
jgi:hypothetical protein